MKKIKRRVLFSFFFLLIFSLSLFSKSSTREIIQQEGGTIKGSIISGDDKELVIRGDNEGKVIVVKILNRRRADGTRGPDERISAFISKLQPGDKVEVNYGYAAEGEFFYIKTITNELDKSGAFMRESNIMAAWVTGFDGDKVSVESIETGKTLTLEAWVRRNDKGEIVKNMDIVNAIKKLKIGQKVLIRYRDQSWQGYFVQEINVISF